MLVDGDNERCEEGMQYDREEDAVVDGALHKAQGQGPSARPVNSEHARHDLRIYLRGFLRVVFSKGIVAVRLWCLLRIPGLCGVTGLPLELFVYGPMVDGGGKGD